MGVGHFGINSLVLKNSKGDPSFVLELNLTLVDGDHRSDHEPELCGPEQIDGLPGGMTGLLLLPGACQSPS